VYIEVTSTLTQEDENRLAPAIAKLLSGALDLLPIAYTLRVETNDQQILHQGPGDLANWDQLSVLVEDRPIVES
jgi:hypothetical protein